MPRMTELGKTVALIPLRGGSKSIPLKNIKEMAGHPLCYHVLKAASEAAGIDGIMVSTDSDQIAEVVQGLGLGATVVHRPRELATDEASTESVMLHAARSTSFDTLVTLQATSPLTAGHDIDEALTMMSREGYDSIVTGVLSKRFYWHLDGRPLNYDPANRPRRQDFPGSVVENGAFYVTTRDVLETHRCRLGGRVGVYLMGQDTMAEIDEPEDWGAVERLLRLRRGPPLEGIGRIKMLVSDVDGTMTNGGMFYSGEGEALKAFNTRDAVGLRRLAELGVGVVALTGEDSPAVAARMRKLGLTEYFPGVEDKLTFLKDYCRRAGIPLRHVAYIGDDLNDLACMRAVGVSACPADAAEEVVEAAALKMQSAGGKGAVREFCDILYRVLSER